MGSQTSTTSKKEINEKEINFINSDISNTSIGNQTPNKNFDDFQTDIHPKSVIFNKKTKSF